VVLEAGHVKHELAVPLLQVPQEESQFAHVLTPFTVT